MQLEWKSINGGRPQSRLCHLLPRLLIGTALIAAGILKGFDTDMDNPGASAMLVPSRLAVGAIEFEFAFGLWMVFGLFPIATRRFAIGCFCLYACVAVYKIAIGDSSCGCFGRFSPAPIHTFLLDLAAIAILWFARPAAGDAAERGHAFARSLGFLTLAIWGGLALAMASQRPASDRPVAALNPEAWVGRRLPVVGHIDVGDRLAAGRWTIVLYRHDCAACKKEIPRYARIAREPSTRSDWGRIALIELPPYGRQESRPASPDGPWLVGRLDDSRKWSIKTPAEITTVDCVVVAPTRPDGGGKEPVWPPHW